MSDLQVTFPCSVNSVPFWQSGTQRRAVDAAFNLGQQRYINSLLPGQTKIPYNCKALFTDTLTFQFKTQQNSALHVEDTLGVITGYSYTNPAQLHVCKSTIGADGLPIPGDVVSVFDPVLNPTYGFPSPGSQFWGIQNPKFDTFYNPLTGATQNLVTYMWSFSFGDKLSQVGGDSGIYFLKFDNFDDTGTLVDTWYSEPILLFGTDALYTPQTNRTLLFQGQNSTDKSDILINAAQINGGTVTYINTSFWFNNPLLFPVFSVRVEASILEYEPKGVFLGFRQENWLQENTLSSSWETFLLTVGAGFGSTNGIPTTFFRIISKYIEMDVLAINNVLYVYDLGEGGTSPSNAWKMKKTRVNGLTSGSIAIRYMYPSLGSLYINPLSISGSIFNEVFDTTFA